jgi:hypothetical protein
MRRWFGWRWPNTLRSMPTMTPGSGSTRAGGSQPANTRTTGAPRYAAMSHHCWTFVVSRARRSSGPKSLLTAMPLMVSCRSVQSFLMSRR